MRHFTPLTGILLLAVVFCSAATAAPAPRPDDKSTLSVLFLGDHGHHQPADRAQQIISALYATGVDIFYTDEVEAVNLENMRHFDAVVFYANYMEMTEAQEQAPARLCRGGRRIRPPALRLGHVPQLGGLHRARRRGLRQPRYRRRTHGTHRRGASGHPWRVGIRKLGRDIHSQGPQPRPHRARKCATRGITPNRGHGCGRTAKAACSTRLGDTTSGPGRNRDSSNWVARGIKVGRRGLGARYRTQIDAVRIRRRRTAFPRIQLEPGKRAQAAPHAAARGHRNVHVPHGRAAGIRDPTLCGGARHCQAHLYGVGRTRKGYGSQKPSITRTSSGKRSGKATTALRFLKIRTGTAGPTRSTCSPRT